MIGLRRNKRGDMVLTIDSYIDIDSTPDIQPDYFDCIYINTKSEHAFHDILFGASPILSWKCSYKPIFVNTAVSGKEQIIDYIVDAYVSDMNNEKVYEIIDRIKMARQKFGVKSETSHPTQPNQLFANILRYLLSRDQRIMGHRLLEKSSLGYINPIFEHYHSMGLFHLNEMFMFIDTMVEFGSLRIHRFLLKEHLCPKCNHSHLLYTECCPKCGSSNLKFQNIIHHFSCANVSPESSYNVGGMLICPKCHKKLRHIGVDYDRPAVVYTCNDCENSFTSPITKATCCYCQSTFPVNTLVPRNIEDYEITEEGIRTLTSGNIMFNNMVNIYDNFMEYYLLMNRLRRQLMETYRKDTPVLGRQQNVGMLAETESHERARPSDALMIQLIPFGRNIGHTDGIFGKFHFISGFADLLCQVTVQSRSYVPIAHFLQRLSFEGSECSRNDVVDTQFAGYDTSHLYSLQVFESLQR